MHVFQVSLEKEVKLLSIESSKKAQKEETNLRNVYQAVWRTKQSSETK